MNIIVIIIIIIFNRVRDTGCGHFRAIWYYNVKFRNMLFEYIDSVT